MKILLIALLCVSWIFAPAQPNPLFDRLPVGPHPVGFKIITLYDSSRVTRPLYNYFGEKETTNRNRMISVHVWYPAKANAGKVNLNYSDYCYNELLQNTNETMPVERKTEMLNNSRQDLQRFFGAVNDNDWKRLIDTKMLAVKDGEPLNEKFPLLIGMLRPLSTSVTNELLASNGFIIAMVLSDNTRWPVGFINDVADMQRVIGHFCGLGMIDADNIGTYGFSGSGFSQILLAMNDPRITALADIESALYGEGVSEILLSSNYYNTAKLHVSFLHIYGKDLTKSGVKFEEFYKKKYSHRYHLLLNQPGLHHWDVATEGRASATILHLRGENEPGIRASFELSNIYLLHFFNAMLKHSGASQKIIDDKKSIKAYQDSLWTIQQYPALKPPPDKLQFEEIVKRKGINEALQLARHFHQVDSSADFIHENALNQLAQNFAERNKQAESVALMKLAIELHPGEAWLWGNLASMQEDFGDKEEALRSSEKVVSMLANDKGSEQSYNQRVLRFAQERIKRLKN